MLAIDDTKFMTDTTGFTMTQSIWQPTTTLTWTDAIVSVKNLGGNVISCGPLVYEFLNSASTSFASTSEISYDLTAKTFSMQTNLPASVTSTFLKLKVSLSSYTAIPAAIKAFKVQFINSCEPPTSTTPSSISTKTYNLTYATALSFVVGAFTVNPTFCQISYSFAISPTITPASVVAFDLTTRTITVQSNDLSLARTYTITVTALSPNNLVITPALSFSLVLVNPCLTATFTIDPSIIAATTSYTLTDP